MENINVTSDGDNLGSPHHSALHSSIFFKDQQGLETSVVGE